VLLVPQLYIHYRTITAVDIGEMLLFYEKVWAASERPFRNDVISSNGLCLKKERKKIALQKYR